jgi:hypothetical protein
MYIKYMRKGATPDALLFGYDWVEANPRSLVF